MVPPRSPSFEIVSAVRCELGKSAVLPSGARSRLLGDPKPGLQPSGFHYGMRSFLSDHPTLRGFLIIALIAAIIVALSLQSTLAALFLIARIAFFLAIAFFIYLVWRERREDIAVWPRRAYAAFYGAAILAITSLAVY